MSLLGLGKRFSLTENIKKLKIVKKYEKSSINRVVPKTFKGALYARKTLFLQNIEGLRSSPKSSIVPKKLKGHFCSSCTFASVKHLA